jgi:hypothetical protein
MQRECAPAVQPSIGAVLPSIGLEEGRALALVLKRIVWPDGSSARLVVLDKRGPSAVELGGFRSILLRDVAKLLSSLLVYGPSR